MIALAGGAVSTFRWTGGWGAAPSPPHRTLKGNIFDACSIESHSPNRAAIPVGRDEAEV